VIEPLMSDERLLADIEQHGRAHVGLGRFALWWLGQSGYLIQWSGTRVLIDPYLSDSLTLKYAATTTPHVRMSRRVIDPATLPRVHVVTSSHNHTDHLDAESIVPVLRASPTAHVIVPEANRTFAASRLGLPPERLTGVDADGCVRADGIEIWAIASAHPTLDRDDQGRHRYLGFVFRFGGYTVYHSGDTLNYAGLAAKLDSFEIDVALLPINGKLGNMNAVEAAQLASQIRAKLAVPCHYDMFEFNTAPPIAFRREAHSLGVRTRILQLGERWNSEDLDR
jgi:L-ascorbate metabolism protein UlaG (beta-lactamase superfamily)